MSRGPNAAKRPEHVPLPTALRALPTTSLLPYPEEPNTLAGARSHSRHSYRGALGGGAVSMTLQLPCRDAYFVKLLVYLVRPLVVGRREEDTGLAHDPAGSKLADVP